MTVDVLSGAESSSFVGDDHGVLVLHGFTGSPAEMRPLATRLASLGFSVELVRLPGHGTSVEDLAATTWADWSSAALAAYDELAGRTSEVAVVGLSMGGGLTAWIAEQRDVAACVFINPFVKPVTPDLAAMLDEVLASGLESYDSLGSDLKDPAAVPVSYDATPLRALKSLIDGVNGIVEGLGTISAPCLLFSSREDHVVPSDHGDDVAARVGGPIERRWLENSYHVATLDFDHEVIENVTADFLTRVFD